MRQTSEQRAKGEGRGHKVDTKISGSSTRWLDPAFSSLAFAPDFLAYALRSLPFALLSLPFAPYSCHFVLLLTGSPSRRAIPGLERFFGAKLDIGPRRDPPPLAVGANDLEDERAVSRFDSFEPDRLRCESIADGEA